MDAMQRRIAGSEGMAPPSVGAADERESGRSALRIGGLLLITAVMCVALTLLLTSSWRGATSSRDSGRSSSVSIDQIEQTAARIDSLSQEVENADLRYQAATLREQVGLLKRELEFGGNTQQENAVRAER